MSFNKEDRLTLVAQAMRETREAYEAELREQLAEHPEMRESLLEYMRQHPETANFRRRVFGHE